MQPSSGVRPRPLRPDFNVLNLIREGLALRLSNAWAHLYIVGMRYIVDAFNVIFKDRALEELLDRQGIPAVRDSFCRILDQYAQRQGIRDIVAVFDGGEKGAHRPRTQPFPGGRVISVFSDPYDKADRYIIDLVNAAENAGAITVVSSDKFVIKNVRASGANSISSRDFWRTMRAVEHNSRDPLKGEDPRKYKGLPDSELDEWMDIFGFKKDE